MTRAALTVLAALLLTSPAEAQAPKAKAPAAPPAFDAQNPQGLMQLLDAAGAKAQTARREEDAVFVTVTSAAANFSLQFAGCNANGRACQAVLFDSLMDSGAATLAQINGFNQTSVMCRIYQDKAGKPHAIYAALLLKSDTPDSARTHLAAWQGCLAEAHAFLRDPVAYLANAA